MACSSAAQAAARGASTGRARRSRARRAGPRPGGHGTLGGTPAQRAVVDVPDELVAQRRAEQDLGVPGESGDARCSARCRRRRARSGCVRPRRRRGPAARGPPPCSRPRTAATSCGGELVAYRQLQRLALLGRGAGGLRPGQGGEFGRRRCSATAAGGARPRAGAGCRRRAGAGRTSGRARRARGARSRRGRAAGSAGARRARGRRRGRRRRRRARTGRTGST